MGVAVLLLVSLLLLAALGAALHVHARPDDDRRFPWKKEMRERTARLVAIVGASHTGFDCEGFEEPSDYEGLVERWLAIAGAGSRLAFRCTREGDRKRFEFRAGEQRFDASVDDRTDWIDLKALLRLTNRALKAIDAPGRFAEVHLSDDQCAQVAYATPEQREALRKARLLFPFPRGKRSR